MIYSQLPHHRAWEMIYSQLEPSSSNFKNEPKVGEIPINFRIESHVNNSSQESVFL